MDRRTSSKTARLFTQPRASHVHRVHGHRPGHTACNEDFRNDVHMKRHARAGYHGFAAAEKPNRTLKSHPSNDLVESWLANTASRHLNVAAPPASVANLPKAHYRRSNRGYDEETESDLSYHKRPACQPRQSLHTNQAPQPPVSPARNRHGHRRRERSISDGSSLLSVVQDDEASTAAPYSIRHHADVDYETSQRDTIGKLDATEKDLTPQRSPAPRSPCFERRPRHRTREDRYNTKKDKHKLSRLEGEAKPHRSKKRKKDSQKKTLLPSKNVMKNFKSGVVLQDRITMPQSLRPGLFKNGREGTLQPITDLAFFDMRFLQERSQDAMPRLPSKKRLKKLEKQSKEIEQVSSFFAPPQKNVESQCSDLEASLTMTPTVRCRVSNNKTSDQFTNQAHSGCSVTENIELIASSRSEWSDDHTIPPSKFEGRVISRAPHESSESSNTTTYFTWSRSTTPAALGSERQASPASSSQDARQSTIPSSVKQVLVETGVFRGTGIPGYNNATQISHHDKDDLEITAFRQKNDLVSCNRKMHASTGRSHAGTSDNANGQLASLRVRWQALLSTEWRERDQDAPAGPSKHKPIEHPIVKGREPVAALQIQTAVTDMESIDRVVNTDLKALSDGSVQFQTPDTEENLKEQGQHDSNRDNLRPKLQLPLSDKGSLALKGFMPPPPIPQSYYAPPLNMVARVNVEGDGSYEGAAAGRLPGNSQEAVMYGADNTFSSVQSASWLPRPHTPVVIIPTRSANDSRNSARHPLWMSQMVVAPEQDRTFLDPGRTPQNIESIVDYIARIEREAQELSSDGMSSEAGIDSELLTTQQMRDSPLHPGDDEQFEGRAQYHQNSGEQVLLMNESLNGGEWQHRRGTEWDGAGMETPTEENNHVVPQYTCEAKEAQQSDAFEEERFEMLEFWRPNQFVRF